MINIANEQIFGKVIADALAVVGNNSNEIYEIGLDGRRQCFAQAHDVICWHTAA